MREKEVEFDISCEIDVIVKAKVMPSRPAPFACDHDSPRFSDPGDNAEVTHMSIWIQVGEKRIDITEAVEDCYIQEFEDDAIEMAEETGQ